jgi:hypothetical protein
MQVTKIMDEQGRIIDPEVSAFSQATGAGFKKLVDDHPEWTEADLIVAAYHVQGYVNSVVIGRIMSKVIKNQQAKSNPIKP